jgi:hypothetical protein
MPPSSKYRTSAWFPAVRHRPTLHVPASRDWVIVIGGSSWALTSCLTIDLEPRPDDRRTVLRPPTGPDGPHVPPIDPGAQPLHFAGMTPAGRHLDARRVCADGEDLLISSEELDAVRDGALYGRPRERPRLVAGCFGRRRVSRGSVGRRFASPLEWDTRTHRPKRIAVALPLDGGVPRDCGDREQDTHCDERGTPATQPGRRNRRGGRPPNAGDRTTAWRRRGVSRLGVGTRSRCGFYLDGWRRRACRSSLLRAVHGARGHWRNRTRSPRPRRELRVDKRELGADDLVRSVRRRGGGWARRHLGGGTRGDRTGIRRQWRRPPKQLRPPDRESSNGRRAEAAGRGLGFLVDGLAWHRRRTRAGRTVASPTTTGTRLRRWLASTSSLFRSTAAESCGGAWRR